MSTTAVDVRMMHPRADAKRRTLFPADQRVKDASLHAPQTNQGDDVNPSPKRVTASKR